MEALQLAYFIKGLATPAFAARRLPGLAYAPEAGDAGDGDAEPGLVDGHPGALELGDGLADGPATGGHSWSHSCLPEWRWIHPL